MSLGNELDPDYQITEEDKAKIKIKDEKDKKEQLEKIRLVINREFNKELKMKENQLEIIQQRILRTQKTLHLLRYILVKSYYNEQELTSDNNENDLHVLSQNRLHPAVKKLLGKNSNRNFLTNIMTRKKRQKQSIEHEVVVESVEPTIKEAAEKIEIKKEIEVVDVKKGIDMHDKTTDIKYRNKSKHRLLVGNISKWMSTENDEDSSTHKWMVYVRGPKESPDISHIVSKIVFYLHPSYRPNDVIEVTESPFHLCRRGWGEFPLRAQICFKNHFNKPIDIIHNLKLDKTYSGRQTLGNETLVDVYLHDVSDGFADELKYFDNFVDMNAAEDKKVLDNSTCRQVQIFLDHNYAKQHSSQEMFKNVLYNTEFLKRRLCGSSNQLPCLKKLKFKSENLNLETITEVFHSMFNNVLQMLPYLLKRLPLVHENALDVGYKCTFPFTANSLEEYLSWNAIKATSCEWSRAKLLKRLIHCTDLNDKLQWSTKNILWYARTHGFTPNVNHKIFVMNKFNKEQLQLERSLSNIRNVSMSVKIEDVEEKIDITEFENDDNNVKPECIHFKSLEVDNSDEASYSFIRQAALDVGVMLKSEELVSGVLINATERMMLVTMKCLAENIVRDTHSTMILEDNYNDSASYIKSSDIYHSLQNTRLGVLLDNL